jgi:hypothetical protein
MKLAMPTSKTPKVRSPSECQRLEQLPNIGPAMAADLRLLGISDPHALKGKDAFVLYQQLCGITGQRHDPCVLDTFMAVVDFMNGGVPAPWWTYTEQRKVLFGVV